MHPSPALPVRQWLGAPLVAWLIATLLSLAVWTPTSAGEESAAEPILNITNVADAETITAGNEASFTMTIWNSGTADATGVTWHDELPEGIVWMFEILSPHKLLCGIASSHVVGGVSHQTIDCDLVNVPPSGPDEGFVVRVYTRTDPSQCGTLLNVAAADAANIGAPRELGGPEIPPWDVEEFSTILVTCPPDEVEGGAAGEVAVPAQSQASTQVPTLPDTATGLSPAGEQVNVPIELLAFVPIGSMGAVALASVRVRNRRR